MNIIISKEKYWIAFSTQMRKLKTKELWFYRRILRIPWMGRLNDVEVKENAKNRTILFKISDRIDKQYGRQKLNTYNAYCVQE